MREHNRKNLITEYREKLKAFTSDHGDLLISSFTFLGKQEFISPRTVGTSFQYGRNLHFFFEKKNRNNPLSRGNSSIKRKI